MGICNTKKSPFLIGCLLIGFCVSSFVIILFSYKIDLKIIINLQDLTFVDDGYSSLITFDSKWTNDDPAYMPSISVWKMNSTLENNISTWKLIRYPELTKNVTCVPKKIGYTQEQADKLFDPNRRFYMCSARAMLKEILWIEDGKFHLKCPEHQFPEIVIGGYLKDELLGQVEFSNRWKPYTEPVDLNGREFAFSRCLRSKKQAILYNNFNRTAAERAENITDNLAKEFGMVSKPRPQTVIMLLFDSLSRQHLYRNLPKTIDFLNKEVDGGAYSNTVMYDFVINNAQGENTIPNLVPLLYGYNLNWHLKRLEGYKLKDESHWWKFEELQQESLWKFYEKMGYVTMFGYDTVWDFLSSCTGRRILTDHVATNFWHGAKVLYGYSDFIERQRCFGPHNSHWYMLNYLNQYVKNYKNYNRFAYVHLSTAHEATGTVIRTADDDLASFFKVLLDFFKQNPDEDFVIHLMSDHGKHSKEWDKRYEGYLENKLPLHILIANKDLIQKLGPQTDEILKHNTKRLVSRFDWYLTLKNQALNPYGKLKLDSELYVKWKDLVDTKNAVSLVLEKIQDERDCDDVGIPSFYCTCYEYTDIELSKADLIEPIKKLKQLAGQIINQKQKTNYETCKTISLQDLTSAEVQILKPIDKGGNRNYRIRIMTSELAF